MGADGLTIVGAGGHGREIWATLLSRHGAAVGGEVKGFVDDDAPPDSDTNRLVRRLGTQVLGPTAWLETHVGRYVLGIGSSPVRRTLAARFDSAGCTATTVVAPDAWLGPQVELGAGSVVFARCTITTNVTIGRHTHLNVGCTVQHDSAVGDFVQFSPGVFVNGDCTIGDDVFLGTGAIVTRGCAVGRGARIGAGSVVLDDVPADVTVIGAPARPSRRSDPD